MSASTRISRHTHRNRTKQPDVHGLPTSKTKEEASAHGRRPLLGFVHLSDGNGMIFMHRAQNQLHCLVLAAGAVVSHQEALTDDASYLLQLAAQDFLRLVELHIARRV